MFWDTFWEMFWEMFFRLVCGSVGESSRWMYRLRIHSQSTIPSAANRDHRVLAGGPVTRAVTRTTDQVAPRTGFRRALYNGSGDALTAAMELAIIPVLFALSGLWLDSRFGTKPLLLMVMVALAIVGLGARAYFTYVAQMAKESEGKPWAPKP